MRDVCLSIFLFISLSAIAQQHFTDTINSIKSSENNPSAKIIQFKDFIARNQDKLSYNNKALAYHEIGIQFFKNKLLDSAILYTEKALVIREKDSELDVYEQNKSLANLSYYHNSQGNTNISRQYLERILLNQQKDRYTIKAYIDLAYHRINIGDYFTALEYLDIISLTLKDELTPDLVLKTQLAYVHTYSEIENPKAYQDIIFKHLVKTEKLFEKVNSYDAGAFYTNTGKIYEHLGQYEKSESYYNKAISHYTAYEDSLSLGIVYNDLGVLASKQELYKNASKYYEQSLEYAKDPYVNAATYDNLGYYLNTKNPSEKSAYYKKAIVTLLNKSSDSLNIYAIKTLKNAPYKTSLLGYYIDLGTSLLESYKYSKEKTYLIEAKEVMHLVDQLVSLIRLESYGENSKLFWINRGVNSYMLAVHICYLLEDLDSAFYFMEKNKSLLLLENLNDLQAKNTTNIPKTLINRELEVGANILEVKEILRKHPNNKEQQQRYLDLLNDKRNLEKKLNDDYPTYQKTKRSLKILTLKEAIELYVKSDTYLASYILNDSDGYVIIVTDQEKYFYKLDNVPKLIAKLSDYKKQLSSPITTKASFSLFNEQSNFLYHQLFPNKKLREQLNAIHLMVIPDYKLLEIPFETLKNDNSSYLVEKIRISYLQSASVYNTALQSVKQNDNSIMAIAPIHYSLSKLQSLEGSSPYMKTLVNNYKAQLLTKEKASKAAFIKTFKDNNIVHINTHAGVSESNDPWIALYDDYIYLNDLYTLENNSNLVILDACKSAEGRLVEGEGILSLSRGFFYSGSKSVIASHWNVNEKTNNVILASFYQKLQEGKSKAVALQLAKKEYLETHQLTELSPYYWAAMTLTGDTAPIYSENSNKSYWYMVLIVIIFPMVYFFVKKK